MHHIEYLPGANLGRRSLIGGAAATTAAALLGLSATTVGWAGPRDSDAFGGLPVEGMLPFLGGATAWLNSTPLTVPDLRDKVVLVNFWTLTCINWLRTLPYVHAWATKY